jgi:hypothetical protein
MAGGLPFRGKMSTERGERNLQVRDEGMED